MYRNIPYEIWKPIPGGYEGLYEISNMGRINSFYVNRIMTQRDSRGYRCINLYKNGEGVTHTVHRLMQMAFNPIPNPEEYQVNHINGIKHDNYYKNLEWCTAQENMIHAHKMGLASEQYGEDNPAAKLSNEDVLEIVGMHNTSNYSQQEIANMFNVSRKNVGDILSGKIWSHLTGILRNPIISEVNPNTKLTKEDILNIVELYGNGSSVDELSDTYGIQQQSIRNIINGVTWSDVTGIQHDPNKPRVNPNAKLDRYSVLEIVQLSEEGYTTRELSERYGIGQQTIRNILRGITWVSVTNIERCND